MSRSSSARTWLGAAWLALLLAHATGWLPLAPVAALDAGLYDARIARWPSPPTDPRVAVVDIDEAALALVGRWPWPRTRLAELVDRLGAEGATLVVLDVLLAEPESPAADPRLADALRRTPSVLALHLNASPGAPRIGELPPGLPPDGAAGLPPWHGHAAPLRVLRDAAAGTGFINALIDADGITRRAPLVALAGGQLQPGLALAALRVLRGDEALRARHWADARGEVLLPYPAESGRVAHHSAAAVLGGRLPADALRGRVVFVGMRGAGLMDQHTAPTGDVTPGVELHANLMSGLLTGRLPQAPGYAPALVAIVLLGGGLLLLAGLPRWSPGVAVAVAGGAALALLAANAAAWALAGLALPVGAPLLAVAGLYALQLFFGQLAEVLKRRRLAALFGQYIPPELVAEMSRDPERYTMEGRAAELTVLFSDVRGFTTFSEQLPPTELAALMNRYLSVMTDIVREHRGTLDKYIGDAVMAFWGAPVADPAHAEHAVSAALAMQAALPALNAEFAARGWPPIRVTIGINTGAVVVGDMGSRHRRAYTVMGDTVNVASRLQELSGKLEVPVLVGEATAAALPGHWPCRLVDQVPIRGRTHALKVYDPRK